MTSPGRLAALDAQARLEGVLCLVRAGVCVISGVTLLVSAAGHPDLEAPAVIVLVAALLSAASALPVARLGTRDARRTAVGSTLVDVVAFAAWSAAFSDRPGAGTAYGVFVVIVGPLRWGWSGALATGLPVALAATVWPQQDLVGNRVSTAQAWLLVTVFVALTAFLRQVVLRGGARARQAEQQFATAFEHASTGMLLLDEALTMLQVNRSLTRLVERPAADLLGRAVGDVVDDRDRPALHAALRALRPDAAGTRLELRLVTPDGTLRWGLLQASLLVGRAGIPTRVVVQVENITARRRSEEQLSYAATHDPLTGLPNRTFLLERLTRDLADDGRPAVLFLDLDRFKVVNDGLGHAAGDALLVKVADRLRQTVRPGDVVARLGGDEFVVLCRDSEIGEAQDVAGRVLSALHEPLPTAGGDLCVGASIGVALSTYGDTAEGVLRDADTAMYAAKRDGGGRVRAFTTDLREAVVRAHELEVELRAAVRGTGLRLVYQPCTDLRSGRVTGVEALLRWDHPVRGPVLPDEFVPLAEESELVVELGDWVLREALGQAAGWPASGAGVPLLSVNVSLRQVLDPHFPGRVARELERAGVPAERLCLEVTETALGGDVERVVAALGVLRRLGLRLAIDDFGTGHASLTYLARFPVDQVKVDKSFVAGLGREVGSAAIVGGVIAMSHAFDLRVVAEGVETAEQLAVLRELDCDAAQGYLIGRPVSAAALRVLLDRELVLPVLPRPRQGRPPLVEDGYRLLVEGVRSVRATGDVDDLLEQVLTALGRVVPVTGGAVLLVEDGQVRIGAARPLPTEVALAARIPIGQGVSGSIAATGEPRYLPDVTIAASVAPENRRDSSSRGIRSWYGVPLVADGVVLGVLQVDSTRMDAFTEAHRQAVLSFAPVVALALAAPASLRV